MTPPTSGHLSIATPSNKFYPPHIDASQSLLRTDLLTSKLPKQITNKKAVIIEAQAGQGKTTLISQFLSYNGYEFIWYQVGPEDSDPVLLLSALLQNFSIRFPKFSSPQLSAILSESEVGPLDLKRCADILLSDLDAFLQHDIFIIFDDLHLITIESLTFNLLEYIIDTSPPRLHFILSSRHPLEMKCKTMRDGNRICYLCTEDLALTEREIEDLFNTVLEKEISSQDALDIHRITNGWIMGIVLAGHPISGKNRFWKQASSPMTASLHEQGHMLDYFQDEIFDKIPDALHIPFLQLSFISEIPVELAANITGLDNFEIILSDMARENFFVYHLDDNKSVFRFHHFFQEFLQRRAPQTLTEANINHIHTQEAEYYLGKDMVDKALASYQKAGDYLTMEMLLQTRGMELIAHNKTLTILALLQSIPEETLFQYSWLTLYAGLLRIDYTPQTTLPFFDAARARFVETGEETGELIALSQTIYFHFVISGMYNLGAKFLPRTEKLLKKNDTTLPIHVKIMAARNLASGYCFFTNQMDKARTYISMACTLSSRHNIRNFIASTHFIQGYIELLSGNRAKYLREAEICFSMLNDPLVGMSNKLTIRVMYLCYLSMNGDFLNFNLQQETIQKSIDKTVINQTVAAPYLYVWGSSCYFSLGKTDQAMELLNKGLGITSTASTGHMHSQLLQWQAFGHAILGDREDALSRITEAAQLRAEAGGPFYEAFHAIIAGATYSRIGLFQEADESLDRAQQLAKEIGSTFLSICTSMHRGYHKLVSHGPEAALDDLETGLTLMKNNGYSHFWGWEPVMMVQLLSLAVRFDIEKGFAKTLARERLRTSFDDKSDAVPLLDISLLDSFQLSLGQKVLCRAKDLTPHQRELLGLLITAKGQRISQERIQLNLWPDNSPEKARKSFDTLLARLRKDLTSSMGRPAKEYINLQKGILFLAHYQIDALHFFNAARIGMVHSKNSDWWQAGNAFQRALFFWKGALPEDIFKSELALTYHDQLVNCLIEFTTAWASHMATTDRKEEAISLIEQVLQTNILVEELVLLLYRLHTQNNAPIKARETLERYRNALAKINYSQPEIEQFIAEVIQSAREPAPTSQPITIT